jgi:hypothetical protein
MPMKKKTAADVPTALRLPGEFLARADKLCGKISKDPMMRVTRSAVLKMAIGRGLEALEREYK